jgi:flagellin
MVINTNTSATASARNLNISQQMLSKSLARLSSGSKITQPSDDAAGLAVSEKMGAQTRRLGAASTNVQNAISYIQTADGFLSGITKVLSRMSELTMMAQDVTKNSGDRALYQTEFQSLQQQLNDTIGGASVTSPLGTFNGIELFGANSSGLSITIGESAGQTMTIAETDLRSGEMSTLLAQTSGAFSISVTDATANQAVIDAIGHVATERAKLGASQSRLEVAANSLNVETQNLEAAISRIRDVDVAEESTAFAKHNILVQSGTAMLAQANQLPQSVLRLLQQ